VVDVCVLATLLCFSGTLDIAWGKRGTSLVLVRAVQGFHQEPEYCRMGHVCRVGVTVDLPRLEFVPARWRKAAANHAAENARCTRTRTAPSDRVGFTETTTVGGNDAKRRGLKRQHRIGTKRTSSTDQLIRELVIHSSGQNCHRRIGS